MKGAAIAPVAAVCINFRRDIEKIRSFIIKKLSVVLALISEFLWNILYEKEKKCNF